jgi:hypothetical protein
MNVLSTPFRIDIDGHVATTGTYAKVVRDQLVNVLMTNRLERIMRPQYGSDLSRALFDPTDELVRSDAARQVMQRIQQWAPRVTMYSVKFSVDDMRTGQVFVDVVYKAGAFAEVQTIKLPVSSFIDQESPL